MFNKLKVHLMGNLKLNSSNGKSPDFYRIWWSGWPILTSVLHALRKVVQWSPPSQRWSLRFYGYRDTSRDPRWTIPPITILSLNRMNSIFKLHKKSEQFRFWSHFSSLRWFIQSHKFFRKEGSSVFTEWIEW